MSKSACDFSVAELDGWVTFIGNCAGVMRDALDGEQVNLKQIAVDFTTVFKKLHQKLVNQEVALPDLLVELTRDITSFVEYGYELVYGGSQLLATPIRRMLLGWIYQVEIFLTVLVNDQLEQSQCCYTKCK